MPAVSLLDTFKLRKWLQYPTPAVHLVLVSGDRLSALSRRSIAVPPITPSTSSILKCDEICRYDHSPLQNLDMLMARRFFAVALQLSSLDIFLIRTSVLAEP